MDNQSKKRLVWILGTFVFGIFLIFLGQLFWPIGLVGLLLALLGPFLSLYLVKPSPKEREQYQQSIQVDNKSRKWHPVLIGIILFAIIIGIVAIGGEKENPSENTQFQQKVSKIVRFVNSQNGLRLRAQPSLLADVLEVLKDKTKVEILREQNGWSKVKVGKKQGWVASRYLSKEKGADFKITTEELYSTYLRTKDASGWKKYDGKIVEVTGIVLSARDYFSKGSVIPQLSEEDKEKILELRKKTIPEDKRCLIQLTCENCINKEGEQGAWIWAYSPSPQFIKGIEKGDKVTLIGRLKWVEDLSPELRNSKVKKTF